jgi:cell wall assembly regulator SMI1
MPTFRNWTKHSKWSRIKPWHARAKREGIEWSLGYYATKEEAQVEEDRFNRAFPRKVNQHG